MTIPVYDTPLTGAELHYLAKLVRADRRQADCSERQALYDRLSALDVHAEAAEERLFGGGPASLGAEINRQAVALLEALPAQAAWAQQSVAEDEARWAAE